MNKTCKKCGDNKPLEKFNKNKTKKSGVSSSRKDCVKIENEKQRLRYKSDPNKNKEIKLYHQNYQKKHRKELNQYLKNYRKDNESLRLWHNKYYHSHKNDPNFRILRNLRSRIYCALKGITKGKSTRKLIGCSVPKLKIHLESMFVSGMTWNNYGEWHLDHIKPCSSFDLRKENEQERCFNYLNLQPLWAAENISKSDKVI